MNKQHLDSTRSANNESITVLFWVR